MYRERRFFTQPDPPEVALARETIGYFHDHYITKASQDLDWRASPLLRDSLAGLPPPWC